MIPDLKSNRKEVTFDFEKMSHLRLFQMNLFLLRGFSTENMECLIEEKLASEISTDGTKKTNTSRM